MFLHLHYQELMVKERQAVWLNNFLHSTETHLPFGNVLDFTTCGNLVAYKSAVTSLKAALSLHINRLLKFPTLSPAGRISLCQLLSDINLADTRPYVLQEPSDLDKEAHEEQWHIVKTLSQSGDIGGAILVLHSYLVRNLGEVDEGHAIGMLYRLGSELSRRISEILIKLDIKLGSEEKKTLEDPGVVIIPFATLLRYTRSTLLDEEFTRRSLAWHWIRDSAMKAWASELPNSSLEALNAAFIIDEECGLEDIFGQSHLHVLFLLEDDDKFTTCKVKREGVRGTDVTSLGSMRLRQDGFTLLAYAAATGLEKTFAHLLGIWPVVPVPCMEHPYHKPMMLSAWHGGIHIIRLLLAVPDDNPEEKQYRLQIAEDIARVNGKTAIAALLRSELEKGDLNLGLVSV